MVLVWMEGVLVVVLEGMIMVIWLWLLLFFCGFVTNSYAEVFALYLSLKACRDCGLFPDVIEFDSKFLVVFE